MEDLILIVREYIEDETEPYAVSDTVIERMLNQNRTYVNERQIYADDYLYDNESLIYPIGYKYLSGLVLIDGDDNEIDSDNYEVDVFNGIITFDASPVVVPDAVYATFYYHNFFDAVAEIWKYRAAQAKFSGKVKLGDEDLPMDKNSREYCLQKYWNFKPSKSTQLER